MVKQARSDHPVRHDVSLLSDFDVYLFNEGSLFKAYEKLGAHPIEHEGRRGVYFAVWAPNAASVSAMGEFNGWDKTSHPLKLRGSSGIWEGFIEGVWIGCAYKYHIVSAVNGYQVDKADPYGVLHETPSRTASRVWDLSFSWNDAAWMQTRKAKNALDAPISIYEIHIGSWRRKLEDGNWRPLNYRELAPLLAEHVKELGFSHVEFMPIMEHPFYGSWGYQVTGLFAPTSRYGTPQDCMYLIDFLHREGIGVILDWVPSHFPTDEHGLGYFDGTHLYEHADPKKGLHPEWNSAIFNYGRDEVKSFLISSAIFWLDLYHADGLRVDGVASMLYLDYGRQGGDWIPNEYGGNENIEAIAFLRRLNEEVYRAFPDVQTIAEESTAWPMVSRPAYVGGLGFGLKWDMGWMHDTLKYFSYEPIFRSYHQGELTFRMVYAFHENFVLPLSHDEVVYGKGSLLNKMPGDDWQKFANLRLLFGYMFAQPGKKLLFMGGEIAQWSEWNHDTSLEWHLLAYDPHTGIKRWLGDLGHAYAAESALFEGDCKPEGFEWVDCSDAAASVLSFIRKPLKNGSPVLAVFNFTPVPRLNYKIGVPKGGIWKEILNSDAQEYGGSGLGNMGQVVALESPCHGRPFSLEVTLPPLAVMFFKPR